MKKSVAITTIVALHAAVLSVLIVQAGCSSQSEEVKKADAAQTAPTEAEIGADGKVVQPVVQRELASPTRPTFDMGDTGTVMGDTGNQKSGDSINGEISAPEKTVTYVVKRGDSISRICKRHGISTGEFIELNNLDRNAVLKIGQIVNLPEGTVESVNEIDTNAKASTVSADTETYVVQRGDSLSRIAARKGMTVSQIVSLNSLKNHNIRIGQKLLVVKGSASAAKASSHKAAKKVSLEDGEIKYTVQKGDILGKIAIKYGTSVSAICKRNGITDVRKVRVGQVLVIKPSKAARDYAKQQEEKKADAVKKDAEPAKEAPAPTPAPATDAAATPVVLPAPAADANPIVVEPQKSAEPAPSSDTADESISVTDI